MKIKAKKTIFRPRILFLFIGFIIASFMNVTTLAARAQEVPIAKEILNDVKTESMTAIFAMGCFWCAEADFQDLEGVQDVISGYAGGTIANPTYQNHNGYKEVIKIKFNPSIISYKKLLENFWRNIDPFDALGQFCDHGDSYKAVIYAMNDAQFNIAQQSKIEMQQALNQKGFNGAEIRTNIVKFSNFYPAEDYHQDYKKKNPIRYKFYRWNCGRDARLAEVWG